MSVQTKGSLERGAWRKSMFQSSFKMITQELSFLPPLKQSGQADSITNIDCFIYKYLMFNLNSEIRVWSILFKILKCHEIKCPRLEISCFIVIICHLLILTQRVTEMQRKQFFNNLWFKLLFHLCNKNLKTAIKNIYACMVQL